MQPVSRGERELGNHAPALHSPATAVIQAFSQFNKVSRCQSIIPAHRTTATNTALAHPCTRFNIQPRYHAHTHTKPPSHIPNLIAANPASQSAIQTDR
ncbi:hypothetical protein E2C01_097669 [Portunus trituberculatus]|uniref:Uncharacterized protein n=1 Tax=Portunus trituberculatus TaxID=210409 RepID=A0A5B7JZ87_PORTR|nr:hypothetical protein [Portunus trituberculatus]